MAEEAKRKRRAAIAAFKADLRSALARFRNEMKAAGYSDKEIADELANLRDDITTARRH